MSLIGGTPDTATRGVVGVILDQASGCSGSLIAPNLVLTARHCVANISSSNGTVQCGVTTFGQAFPASEFIVTTDDNIRNGVPAGAQFGVTRVVTTPGNMVCGNDVALLILSSNISSATAPLIPPRLDTPVVANESFDAVGYGITDPDDVQGATFGQRLRVNGLDVLCVGTACGNLGGSRTEWGAVTPVCSGDSGGPALDTAGNVIGVASRGNADCDSALYGAVASWGSLIRDTAIDAADDGGYAPPTWTGATTDGGTPDSGTPDSGTPDSGTPDSGTPDSGNPMPDSGTPEPDAGGTVGEPCTGACGGDLACYLPENDDQGICVPRCSSSDTTCPFRYECSARLGICVPGAPDEQPDDDGDDDDNGDSGGCGCRAAKRPDGSGPLALAFLMLVGVARRRRRA
jgi:MYXO-CTERM domain-containing protein